MANKGGSTNGRGRGMKNIEDSTGNKLSSGEFNKQVVVVYSGYLFDYVEASVLQ